MIYSACIIDSITKVMLQRVSIDTDKPEEINLISGTEIASRNDGEIGWTLLPTGEWYNPNPPQIIVNEQTVRSQRNILLKKSDKYSFQDFPITQEKRNEWFTYRQALRDITSQPGFPEDVVWPDPPN